MMEAVTGSSGTCWGNIDLNVLKYSLDQKFLRKDLQVLLVDVLFVVCPFSFTFLNRLCYCVLSAIKKHVLAGNFLGQTIIESLILILLDEHLITLGVVERSLVGFVVGFVAGFAVGFWDCFTVGFIIGKFEAVAVAF